MTTGDQGWRRSSAEDRTLKSQLARDWAQAVASLAYRPTTRAEIELYLRSHLETLHDALLADPFSPEPGRRIGASLVRIHLTKPETVEETVVLLADRLLTDLGLDTYTFQPQLNRLLGALAQGFAKALRDRALSDLEQTYSAALAVNLGQPLVRSPQPPGSPPGPPPGSPPGASSGSPPGPPPGASSGAPPGASPAALPAAPPGLPPHSGAGQAPGAPPVRPGPGPVAEPPASGSAGPPAGPPPPGLPEVGPSSL